MAERHRRLQMRCTATFDFAAAPLLERLIVRVRATRATAAPAARVGGIAEGHGPCAQAAASKDAGSAREKVRVQSGSVASSVVFGARLSRQGRRAPPQVAGQTFSSIKLLPCWVCPLRDNSRQHAFGCVDPQRGRSNSPAARRNEEVTLRYPCCLPPRLLAAVAPPLLRPPPLAWCRRGFFPRTRQSTSLDQSIPF